MSQSKTIPLVFIACAMFSFGAIAGLRAVFATAADVEYWEHLDRDAVGAEVAEMREKEAEALSGLEGAKSQMATKGGRMKIAAIKPGPDMQGPPMTGWMHHPDFSERVEMAKAVKAKMAEREAAKAAAAAPAPEAAE